MPRIPIIKAKDFHKHLVKYGCKAVSIRGSHHKVRNPKTNKTSIVAIRGGDDIDKGTFADTLEPLGIDVYDFLEFIN